MSNPSPSHIYINQIRPDMRDIHLKFAVVEIGPTQRSRPDVEPRVVKIADQTGSINLCLSAEQDPGLTMKKVYILRNGLAVLRKGHLSLWIAKSDDISALEDSSFSFVEMPDWSALGAISDCAGKMKKGSDVENNGRKGSSECNPTNGRHIFINQLAPGMKSISTCFLVLEIISPKKKDNNIEFECRARVADPTASVILITTNEAAEFFHPGDIWRLKNGFTTAIKGCLHISVANSGELIRTGEFCMIYTEFPDMSAYNSELDDSASQKQPTNLKRHGEDDKEEPGRHAQSYRTRILQPNMKQVNTVFIVLDVGAPRQTSQGNEVRTVKIADHTGSIQMAVWNELGEYIMAGDIFRLKNGCTVVNRGCLGLSTGKTGELIKTGEFNMPYNELPDMSVYNGELDSAKVLANVAQIK
ncbi:SOSS complex subunit B2 [Ditylenchus destructor]|nr:SOSS complex subunit B2 [Ditylenchus destructor]